MALATKKIKPEGLLNYQVDSPWSSACNWDKTKQTHVSSTKQPQGQWECFRDTEKGFE